MFDPFHFQPQLILYDDTETEAPRCGLQSTCVPLSKPCPRRLCISWPHLPRAVPFEDVPGFRSVKDLRRAVVGPQLGLLRRLAAKVTSKFSREERARRPRPLRVMHRVDRSEHVAWTDFLLRTAAMETPAAAQGPLPFLLRFERPGTCVPPIPRTRQRAANLSKKEVRCDVGEDLHVTLTQSVQLRVEI